MYKVWNRSLGKKVLVISSVTWLVLMVVVHTLLYQIYGCAGAAFAETGACSSSTLDAYQNIASALKLIAYAVVGGIVLGLVMVVTTKARSK